MSKQNTDEDNWRPLSREIMPPQISASFSSEFPNGAEIRDWVISEFEAQTGAKFDPQIWTNEIAALFRRWWWFQLEQGDFIFWKRPRLQKILHQSLSDKANSLAQRHCNVCSGMLPSEAQFPISVIPVRIAPQSRQSLDTVNWFAFQAAVKSWFAERTLDLGTSRHLCIALTYVLSTDRRDRDLDNMTKALMDAFSRAIGFDDRDIHHLDVLKLLEQTPEEFVYVRVAPSHLHDNSTVMIPIFNGKWAVGDALSLEDFKRA